MNVGALIWRSVLLILACLTIWVALRSGLGGYFASSVGNGDSDALDLLLSWQPRHPEGLYRRGAGLPLDDREGEALLEQTYRADPADPRPLLALARRAEVEMALEHSDALMTVAARLAPVDARVQFQVAVYWGRREEYGRMLMHLSQALEADTDLQGELFPIMLKLAEQPQLRGLLESTALTHPSWWTEFFQYAAARLVDLDGLRYLYGLRRASKEHPLSADERAAYVERLYKEGLLSEAYLIWVSGLEKAERSQLGLLFNGGFELPLANRSFGWRIEESQHFSVRLASTYGMTGSSAMQLRFRHHAGQFNHVSQRLFLQPGHYRLIGLARADGLRSKGGLRWEIHCTAPRASVLGESPRLLGASDWKRFELSFEVTMDCEQQLLRLSTAGQRRFEWTLDGDVWFDDIMIERVQSPGSSTDADALVRERDSEAPDG